MNLTKAIEWVIYGMAAIAAMAAIQTSPLWQYVNYKWWVTMIMAGVLVYFARPISQKLGRGK